jgi:hypothetical protein
MYVVFGKNYEVISFTPIASVIGVKEVLCARILRNSLFISRKRVPPLKGVDIYEKL